MTQSVSAPTSYPNVGVGLPCPVMRIRIGLKQSVNFSPNLRRAEVRDQWQMENVFVNLAQALRERLALIRNEESRRDEAGHMARLREVSDKIDKLEQVLPQPIDPRLAHYLQRKSYEKALGYLEDQDN